MSSLPKTLLQIAGANLQPAILSEAALVIIDAQQEYTDGGLPLPGVLETVTQIRALLEQARNAGRPIFHVVHHGKAGSALFNPESSGVDIIPELTPIEGEPVIIKSLPNSFAKTDLNEQLKGLNIQKVIWVGFMTHMCVESTVRAALDLGYQNTVVASACATRDLPDDLGNIVPAHVLHHASLAALSDRFAIIVNHPGEILD